MIRPQNGYIFRIRATENEDGTIKGGLYGMIYGAGVFFSSATDESKRRFETGFIFINPTPSDQNIEMDRNRNLWHESIEQQDLPRFP